jgi:hypothetical protein
MQKILQKILWVMVAIALAPVSAEAADSSGVAKQDQRMATSKPRAATTGVARNACASYGAGFVQIDGTNTCVKMGGSVSVSTGASSR